MYACHLPSINNYKWKTKHHQIFEENKQNKRNQIEVAEQMPLKKLEITTTKIILIGVLRDLKGYYLLKGKLIWKKVRKQTKNEF